MTPMPLPLTYPLRATRAYIDLDALEHNLSLLAARAPYSVLVPAVKADAYGHGVEAVASACRDWGAAMLAVANLEEFLYLRERDITLPVLILEDLPPWEIDAAIAAGARLNVSSPEYARAVSAAAVRRETVAIVHINVDTGMGRMGLLEEDPVGAIIAAADLRGVNIEGVFTHFPASDEADKTFALSQVDAMTALQGALARAGVHPRFFHSANSGALIDFPDRVDSGMVRPGIAMYGIYPSREVDTTIALRPVMRLESVIVKVTRYAKEWTVGYGRTYRVGPGSVIGIVPIGYGDGYPRSLSNRGSVLIHGMRVPIAGRVSMDMIAVDLTNVPEPVAVGDPVVLMGGDGEARIGAEDLADLTGTIPYEITCDITMRVPRVYLRGGNPTALKSVREGYRALPTS